MYISKKNFCPLFLLIFSIFIAQSCNKVDEKEISIKESNSQNHELLKEVVRNLLSDIYAKDIEGIFQIVNSDGVYDGDSYFTYDEYLDMTTEKNGHVKKVLFEAKAEKEIHNCAERGGVIFVSPYQYHSLFKDNYNMAITQYDGEPYYNIKFEDKRVDNCFVKLWPLEFQKIGDKYYTVNLLFE